MHRQSLLCCVAPARYLALRHKATELSAAGIDRTVLEASRAGHQNVDRRVLKGRFISCNKACDCGIY